MVPAIKFCGLTKPGDAHFAAALSAGYAGVIFAGGPRSLTESQAEAVLESVHKPVKKVGVMGRAAPDELAGRGRRLGLDVIQMHGDPSPDDVSDLRAAWDGLIWAVVRSNELADIEVVRELFARADGVLIDSGSRGSPGGTGVSFDWESLASLNVGRGQAKLILAGGLNAENVAAAIRIVRPDIVDVSSGVETTPGVKDHEKMRDFVTSVHSAGGK